MNKKLGKMIVLYGPSGAGKTKFGNILRELGITKLVSDTTREIRYHEGEIDGVSYNFKTKDEFLQNVENEKMVEYSSYCGNLYGLSKNEVFNKLQNNDIVFAVVESNGVINLKKTFGDLIIPIFVYIPKNILKERLNNRGDSKLDINERLNNFEENNELEDIKYADFCIINKDLETSISQLKNIINIV